MRKMTGRKMMSKKIVVIGCDNSGKTTLCEMLVKKFPELNYVHSKGPGTAREMLDNIHSEFASEKNIIFDRFSVIEEKVCGVILRGEDKINNPEYQAEADSLLEQIDLFIVCCPSNIDIVANFGNREQMDGVKEHYSELYSGYIEVAKELMVDRELPVIFYDWTIKSDWDFVCSRVKELLS